MVALSGRTGDGVAWRLAPALVKLEQELNARYPHRTKGSDGSIASAAHSVANPTSDHEADRDDGLVKAIDLTDDDPHFDIDAVVDTFVRNQDDRIKYVIRDQQIARSYDKPGIPAWTWAPYSGSNGHWSHAHISVTDAGAHDTRSWFATSAPKDEFLMSLNDWEQADLLARVRWLTPFDPEYINRQGDVLKKGDAGAVLAHPTVRWAIESVLADRLNKKQLASALAELGVDGDPDAIAEAVVDLLAQRLTT